MRFLWIGFIGLFGLLGGSSMAGAFSMLTWDCSSVCVNGDKSLTNESIGACDAHTSCVNVVIGGPADGWVAIAGAHDAKGRMAALSLEDNASGQYSVAPMGHSMECSEGCPEIWIVAGTPEIVDRQVPGAQVGACEMQLISCIR